MLGEQLAVPVCRPATRTRQLQACLRMSEPRLATMSRAKPADVPTSIDGLSAPARAGAVCSASA